MMKFLKLIGWIEKMRGQIMLKKGLFCTAFGYVRYSEAIEKITGFGMKNNRTLPSLGLK